MAALLLFWCELFYIQRMWSSELRIQKLCDDFSLKLVVLIHAGSKGPERFQNSGPTNWFNSTDFSDNVMFLNHSESD